MIEVLNPASSTLMLYRPGCTLPKRYAPRSSLTVVCDVPVPMLLSVMLAPGITCFWVSVTSPTKAAVPVCAQAALATSWSSRARARTTGVPRNDERDIFTTTSTKGDKQHTLVPGRSVFAPRIRQLAPRDPA